MNRRTPATKPAGRKRPAAAARPATKEADGTIVATLETLATVASLALALLAAPATAQAAPEGRERFSHAPWTAVLLSLIHI